MPGLLFDLTHQWEAAFSVIKANSSDRAGMPDLDAPVHHADRQICTSVSSGDVTSVNGEHAMTAAANEATGIKLSQKLSLNQ